jgi:hypothetical protein
MKNRARCIVNEQNYAYTGLELPHVKNTFGGP